MSWVHFEALVVFLMLCWLLLPQVDSTTIKLVIGIQSCSSFAFMWQVAGLRFADNHPILVQTLSSKVEHLFELVPEHSKPIPMRLGLLIALVSP